MLIRGSHKLAAEEVRERGARRGFAGPLAAEPARQREKTGGRQVELGRAKERKAERPSGYGGEASQEGVGREPD